MRKNPSLPAGVTQNEEATAVFTIGALYKPNVVFDPEALDFIEERHAKMLYDAANVRFAIGIGLLSEIKIECPPGNVDIFATLVFATYGGGYYVQRSKMSVFAPVVQ